MSGVETEVLGGPASRGTRQAGDCEPEHVVDGQFRYHPADSYMNGELRVYTQPLGSSTRSGGRSETVTRYAVHDVVHVRLTSCMESWGAEASGETHNAFVIRQHDDGTCDVRLTDDLSETVLGVRVQSSAYTIDEDVRTRLREYDGDVHGATELYTESGAHVSRHATSVAQVNDGTAGESARRHNDG